MPSYLFQCADNHATEVSFTLKEWEDYCITAKDEDGRVRTECSNPECVGASYRVFTLNDVVYHAPGFYGKIPTMCAHNSGHM